MNPPPTSVRKRALRLQIVAAGALSLFLRKSGTPSHTSGIRLHKTEIKNNYLNVFLCYFMSFLNEFSLFLFENDLK